MIVTQAVLGVREGAAEETDDLRGGEGVENVNLGARKQRVRSLRRMDSRGRADQENVAGFHVGEKGILLGFVEAVDFIHEDNGALAGRACARPAPSRP